MDQGKFLDILRSRLAEAQKRFVEKQQALQRAQVEFNSAAQEFNSWQFAVAAESKKQQEPARAVTAPMSQPSSSVVAPEGGGTAPREINKTDMIRQILQQHPNGMSPAELWKQLEGRIAHRPYVYSILKRLKDKGEVEERRGKYFFKPPVVQEAPEPITIQ